MNKKKVDSKHNLDPAITAIAFLGQTRAYGPRGAVRFALPRPAPPGPPPGVWLGPFPVGLGWLVCLQPNKKVPFKTNKKLGTAVYLPL